MSRQFAIVPGKREALPLFIGLTGPSSSGKTRSAFELAVGMQSVIGGEIVFINTEGRRGLLDIDRYGDKIKHMPFNAPYASLDYLSAIKQATASGAKTIVIDSMSHEHESEGGMLDYQDQELRRLAKDDYGTWKAEKYNMLAWQAPKAARRTLLTRGIMQADVNIIATFRAKQTSKPIRVDGKTKVIDMGFTPIAGDEFVFEMALSAFLPPMSRGVPDWNPENPGERMAVKRNDQLERIVPNGAQLSHEIGARLAEWARGGERSAPARNPVDEYALEFAANLKAMPVTDLAEWWLTTTETRAEIGVPEDREARMGEALAKRMESEA